MQVEYIYVQKLLDWVKCALKLNNMVTNAQHRQVRRGQVYRCYFGVGIGSEMQKERPAVIIQNDSYNRSSGNTIVVPITHDSSTLSCMVPITPVYESDGVTPKLDGQANTTNIMCISKARLGDYVATLSNAEMRSIDEALAKSVGLMPHYAAITQKLNDKLSYIAKIKAERNTAQDELSEICSLLGVSDAKNAIAKLQDNH